MSIIGELKEMQNEKTGEVILRGGISHMGADQSVMLVPNEAKTKDTHPDFRVVSVPKPKYGDGEIGAAYKATKTSDGTAYLSLSISGGVFPRAFRAASFDGREAGEKIIIYNAPRDVEGGAA